MYYTVMSSKKKKVKYINQHSNIMLLVLIYIYTYYVSTTD